MADVQSTPKRHRLVRDPGFLRLWSAETISHLGSNITAFALPIVQRVDARSRDVQSDPFRRKSSDRKGRLADTSFSLFKSNAAFVRQMDSASDYGHSDFDQRHNMAVNFDYGYGSGKGDDTYNGPKWFGKKILAYK